MFRILLIGICLLGLSNCAIAQVIEEDLNTENYAFEVKLLDEFFERFNSYENTFISKFLKTHYPQINLSRKLFITTLFDLNKYTDKELEDNEFINKVIDSPLYLSFYDDNWYAEVECKFIYKGKSVVGSFILKNTKIGNGSAWEIYSIKMPFIDIPENCKSTNEKTNKSVYLNPATNDTKFLELYKIFNQKEEFHNFIKEGHISDQTYALIHHAKAGNIQLEEITKINYHMLQISDWYFKVNYFEREGRNSGWLISELQKLTSEEKIKFKKTILNLDL